MAEAPACWRCRSAISCGNCSWLAAHYPKSGGYLLQGLPCLGMPIGAIGDAGTSGGSGTICDGRRASPLGCIDAEMGLSDDSLHDLAAGGWPDAGSIRHSVAAVRRFAGSSRCGIGPIRRSNGSLGCRDARGRFDGGTPGYFVDSERRRVGSTRQFDEGLGRRIHPARRRVETLRQFDDPPRPFSQMGRQNNRTFGLGCPRGRSNSGALGFGSEKFRRLSQRLRCWIDSFRFQA